MAKRRSHKRKTGRRRRIGSLAMSLKAGSPLVKYGSMAAGFAFSTKIKDAIDKVTGGKIDDKIIDGVLAAGSLYYLFINKGKKSTLFTVLAGLAAGASAKGLLSDFGVLSGFRDMPVLGSYNVPAPMLNGVGNYQNVPVVSGYVPGSGRVMGGIGRVYTEENRGGSGYMSNDHE